MSRGRSGDDAGLATAADDRGEEGGVLPAGSEETVDEARPPEDANGAGRGAATENTGKKGKYRKPKRESPFLLSPPALCCCCFCFVLLPGADLPPPTPDHPQTRSFLSRRKAWDTNDIDRWKIEEFRPEHNPQPFLEESIFATLFPSVSLSKKQNKMCSESAVPKRETFARWAPGAWKQQLAPAAISTTADGHRWPRFSSANGHS
ncbi:MAG: hypothetical protein BJ554DRAFT_3094 [Olpidium bornovanus]|uniref:Uncharacterized protein n=1 Tax=Olpidium bornovanus TaxID=278681 RepID=A0A8H7ZQ01_9FUNG|nr:MAG: hypothetical protein BJ554DRAFT_3094 [Olpidium bornovanus]